MIQDDILKAKGQVVKEVIAHDPFGYDQRIVSCREPKMDKVARMERTARVCFVLGTISALWTLAHLLPIAGSAGSEEARQLLHGFIDAFWHSPYSPF